MSCPECGADLREVGIIKSKSSNKTIWIAMGLLIVVGMFVLCLVSAMFLWMAAPSAETMPIGPPPPPARTQGTSKPIDLVALSGGV